MLPAGADQSQTLHANQVSVRQEKNPLNLNFEHYSAADAALTVHHYPDEYFKWATKPTHTARK
jgi:hypothetical protein